ncbi:MAG: N-acetylglucosamine-6-phosphate deacetylase [Gammaproteobacteria bacterium]|nr:N-acetylglucosamine-6-phosphate deacetylase [Gammaproteobacteria bacterium]
MVNHLILSGGNVYTSEGVLTNKALVIQDGVIQKITKKMSEENNHFVFPDNYHILPGFIDLHVHGIKNADVMDATADALDTICQALAAEGTTSFLATTMTADTDEIDAAVETIQHYICSNKKVGAEILGIHLEGPFLSPKKMGAQPGDKIQLPNVHLLRQWQKKSGNAIRLVTLAPEQTNCIELINYLVAENIICSIGHTNATYAQTVDAIAAGCTHVTHLFNAMSGIHQREPGAVTAALLSNKVMTELIVDGFHLHPAIVELTFKLKGKDNILLVTDAMRAKCMQDGCYDLGGQAVHVKQGQAQLADGTLAGSVLSMTTAIKNMMKFTGCELIDTIKMTSENPARALNVFSQKGSIVINKDADIVVLDDDLNVVMTVVQGKVVYQR